MKTNELANRRIAFEEEKLVREKHDVEASLGEAETLRRKLRDQVSKRGRRGWGVAQLTCNRNT